MLTVTVSREAGLDLTSPLCQLSNLMGCRHGEGNGLWEGAGDPARWSHDCKKGGHLTRQYPELYSWGSYPGPIPLLAAWEGNGLFGGDPMQRVFPPQRIFRAGYQTGTGRVIVHYRRPGNRKYRVEFAYEYGETDNDNRWIIIPGTDRQE